MRDNEHLLWSSTGLAWAHSDYGSSYRTAEIHFYGSISESCLQEAPGMRVFDHPNIRAKYEGDGVRRSNHSRTPTRSRTTRSLYSSSGEPCPQQLSVTLTGPTIGRSVKSVVRENSSIRSRAVGTPALTVSQIFSQILRGGDCEYVYRLI